MVATPPAAPQPAAPSILTRLHDELVALEGNWHNLADPSLAVAGKMREIVAELVKAAENTDLGALGAKVDAALGQIEAALEQFAAIKPAVEEAKALLAKLGSLKDLGAKAQQAISAVEILTGRIAALEAAKPAPAPADSEQPPAPAKQA